MCETNIEADLEHYKSVKVDTHEGNIRREWSQGRFPMTALTWGTNIFQANVSYEWSHSRRTNSECIFVRSFEVTFVPATVLCEYTHLCAGDLYSRRYIIGLL